MKAEDFVAEVLSPERKMISTGDGCLQEKLLGYVGFQFAYEISRILTDTAKPSSKMYKRALGERPPLGRALEIDQVEGWRRLAQHAEDHVRMPAVMRLVVEEMVERGRKPLR